MARDFLTGENVLLEALDSGVYVPFACATSVEFSYETELKEKASPGQGGFREYVAGLGDWGITLNTVTHIVPSSPPMLTVFYTLLAQVRKNGLDIRLTFEDENANLQVITGHVLIPSTTIASPVDSFSEDTIEMKGSGSFALSQTLINPSSGNSDVFPPIDYTSASGGETSLNYSALINRTILAVMRDGINYEVITTGTPNAKQVKFNAGVGDILFSFPLSIGEWVHILYK